ncbi:MAG: murein biosynthesis integral membrane protein MurJ [Holosporales bacterium]|jgi:putative peptidoglycan lipid II flippase|nr:murein biosynthesis integral membrane protein MurJ [Holosporales bacterium]
MSILRRFWTVSGITVLSRILGVFREAALIHFLGATAEMDAFSAAFKFPTFFRRLFAEGGMQSIFVPFFNDYYSVGKVKGALYFASRLFSIIFWVMLAFTALVWLFAEQFVMLMAPGFIGIPDKMAFATEFTKIIFPSVWFISLSTVYSGILMSRRRLLEYAFSQILVNCILITSLFMYTNDITAGRRISYGVLISGICLFFYMMLQTKRSNLPMPRMSSVKLTPGMKLFLKKLIPVLVAAGVAQINIFIGTVVASFCPTGCITYIYCADRFVQLPLAIFGITMGLVLLPEISEAFATKKLSVIQDVQANAVIFTLRLVLPSVIGLIVLAYCFISIVYGHGRFTESAILSTTRILQIVSVGLPASVIVKIMTSILIAQKDSRTPLVAATIAIVVNAVASVILAIPFQEIGIAVATTISGIVNAGWLLRKAEVRSIFSRQLLQVIGKVACASIGMIAVMLCMSTFLESIGITNEILLILMNGTAGLLAYTALLMLMKDTAALKIIAWLRR